MGLLQHKRFQRSTGFGLIELVITIAIVAILVAIALPSFSTSIRNNRVSTQTNDFLSAVNYARNEAITRSRGVTLCAADTASGTPAACGSAAAWETGWMVIVDNATGISVPSIALDADGAALILRTWVGNPNNDVSVAQRFIRFDSRGQAVADVALPATFILKPESNCSGDQQRRIVVSSLGRSSATKEACI